MADKTIRGPKLEMPGISLRGSNSASENPLISTLGQKLFLLPITSFLTAFITVLVLWPN